MLLSFKESNYYHLIQRGVPKSVLASSDVDIGRSICPIEISYAHRISTIRSSAQLKVLEKTLKKPLKPFLYVIAGKADAELAKVAALSLMDSYLTKCMKHNENITHMDDKMRLPIWHTLYSTLTDSMRDHKDWMSTLGLPGFLVLETLYENSSRGRLDKARDLLSMFSDIPRVLIVVGQDPISYCRTVLYNNPNKVLYFEDNFELQTQQI